jgi:uncharacterized membrane protein
MRECESEECNLHTCDPASPGAGSGTNTVARCWPEQGVRGDSTSQAGETRPREDDMPSTDLSILIDAPLEAVFDFVADPRNTVKYQREFSTFEPVGHPPRGLGMTVDARGKFKGLPVRAKLRIVEFVPNERIVSRSVAFLKSRAEWHFSVEDGKTLVRFVAQYDWPVPLPARAMSWLLENEIDAMAEDSLRRLKLLVEEGRRTAE